ncbi:hypothetical protein QBC38DRAFT_98008 [Podospora fimiseda]|uniref:FHA domain-containing protein n=1 Tax=Podospora fimiseda TaxID=252190 RepID=A0AAN7BTZ7_9PEZI|nr:hypothetical protein QBC38DRAFT_98008 [Podospora fimiseda]
MSNHTWRAGHQYVLICLEACNDKIQFRQIIFDSNNKSIKVGRSSMVPSKGFLAGPNNTWFDSPVMSRKHAEIVVDLDREMVAIKDEGSLHGTYVNDKTRVDQELRKLQVGDKITFGTSIFRGSSEFSPAVAYVREISFNKRDGSATTTTFQVPDGSDCSSIVDDYSSDQDSVTQKRTKSKPDAMTGNVIDLTGASMGGEVIDLSSIPSSPARMRCGSRDTPVINLVDDDDDDDDEDDEDDEDDDDEDDDDDDDSESEVDEGSTPTPSSPTTNVAEFDEDVAMGLNDEPFVYSDKDEDNSLSDQSDGESYQDYPDDDESVDGSEHDSELDEDMASDIDSFAEDSEEEYEDEVSNTLRSAPVPVRELPKWAEIMDTIKNDTEAYNSGFSAHLLPNADVTSSTSAVTAPTAASPRKSSDSMKIGKLLNVNPDQEAEMLSPSGQFYSFASQPISYLEMGRKTGKTEFFAAMEHNKALFAQAKEAPAPVYPKLTEPEPELELVAEPESVAEPEPEPEPEPELDSEPFGHASATWVPSTPMEVTVDPDSGFLQSKRTYVRILDIIDSAPNKLKRKPDEMSKTSEQEVEWDAAQRGTSKAADPTESILQEPVNTIQSKDDAKVGESAQVATPATSHPETESAAESPLPQEVSNLFSATAVTAEAEKGVMAPLDEQQRPAKRARLFRRFVEHVGMAVAGGAMVMGTLIYTAPTFA